MRPAARTLGPILLAAALLLPACGREEPPVAGKAAARADGGRKAALGARPPCGGALNGLLDSLDALRGRLAVGLSYEMYLDEVQDLRELYARIPVDRLTIDCVAAVGTPSERALNRYIEAANTWGECLADVYCASSSVEPELQRKWRVASNLLSSAHIGARGMQGK